jgi:hypothetical protein
MAEQLRVVMRDGHCLEQDESPNAIIISLLC